MIRLSKKEILNSLSRISILVEDATRNPDIPMSDLINKIYYMTDNENQFLWDFRIYALISDLRVYSYLEDTFIESIKDNEVDLGDLKERIFINKKDAKRFSNKQIIKNIRDAVAHSDEDKELFKITPNGKYLAIDLLETKPIEFHVKLSYQDLSQIISKVFSKGNCFYYSYVDRKNNILHRIYVNEKIDLNKIREYCSDEIQENYDYDKLYIYIIDYLNKNNISYEDKTYSLNESQISILKDFEKTFNHNKNNFDNADLKDIESEFFSSLLHIIIPLGIEKASSLNDHLNMINLMLKYNYLTFNEFSKIIIKSYYYEDAENVPEELSNFVKDKKDRQYNIPLTLNKNILVWETIMQVLTYFYSCSTKDEVINLSNTSLQKKNLRNALVHGRWFFADNENIILLDRKNGKNNDYEFYMSEKVNLKELFGKFIESTKNEDYYKGNVEFTYPEFHR